VITVILAGGLGSRLSEETVVRPKPMVEIGGKPIIWHIMRIYSSYGLNDFVICLGYKGYIIKEYFYHYFLHQADVTLDMKDNSMNVRHAKSEPWTVSLVDTGENTMTGGRLKRVREYLGNEDFCFTYGDGLGDIDIDALIASHRNEGRLATVTAVRPPSRFGRLDIEGESVTGFTEKPAEGSGWINGGFFVLSPEVIDYIEGDGAIWEQEPMQRLASDGQLSAYRHTGFWQPMDTLRDKRQLEELWNSGNAPWKVWD